MPYETLFYFCSFVIGPFWFLMIALPHWSVTKRIIGSPLIVLPTALVYVALTAPVALPVMLMLTNPSFSAVGQLLATPEGLVAAWAHFVTSDLFVGRWAYLESRAQNFSAWLMAPVLFMILMLGPLGLVLYLVLRYAYAFRRARNNINAARA